MTNKKTTETPSTGKKPKKRKSSNRIPVLPLQHIVLFPYSMTSLTLETEEEIALAEDAVASDRLVALTPSLSRDGTVKSLCDLFEMGCIARIVKILRFPDKSMRALVRGLRRVRIVDLVETKPYPIGTYRNVRLPKEDVADLEFQALFRNARTKFEEIISMSPNLPDELQVAMMNIEDYGRLADMIAETLPFSLTEKTVILDTPSISERYQIITPILNRELQVARLESEINNSVNSAFAAQHREQYLREQLSVIQKQLGEDTTTHVDDLRKRLEKATLPEEAAKAAKRELGRTKSIHPASPEYNVSRNYLEWLLDLPWGTSSEDQLNLKKAFKILEKDHYDLEKIKERILEHLAVRILKGDNVKGPILCFVGPPGVGKTSLGRSIARAMGRKFQRLSLGGIRDEAEIRGHRRTYIGALPGRIIQCIKKAGTTNPVIMLDEIDKLGSDFRGDPSSALLEVLDPQQNSTFSDHYLEVPFDLSGVLFIMTANLTDSIPSALLDRMEVLRLPGYTPEEKRQIARRYLTPRALEENGLNKKQLFIPAKTVDSIIDLYTREAGVRNLERQLGAVCRKHARSLVEGTTSSKERTTIAEENLKDYLGPQKLFPDALFNSPQIGLVTGLAWTAAGGSILHIEVSKNPGKGALVLTGSLGDVMKESAQIALTYIRSRHKELDLDPGIFEKTDFHIHVPDGATPKDGPSAGVTIASAFASLLTERPVKPLFALTGELSLRGRVLPVGGIKEKVLAAVRSGVKTVILPKANANDLDEIPEPVRNKMEFCLIEQVQEALELILQSD